MNEPRLLPGLLLASLLLACGVSDEVSEPREYTFQSLSGTRIVIRPGSTDTTSDFPPGEFDAFLGGRVIPLVSRIHEEDGDYRITLDTANLRARGWTGELMPVPAAAVTRDSVVFDLIGEGITLGMDTLVVHRHRDTLAIRFFGLKMFMENQMSSHFGYKFLPEHRAVLNTGSAIPGLDSIVFYAINLNYLDAATDPAR